jgi:hypothetical protein
MACGSSATAIVITAAVGDATTMMTTAGAGAIVIATATSSRDIRENARIWRAFSL